MINNRKSGIVKLSLSGRITTGFVIAVVFIIILTSYTYNAIESSQSTLKSLADEKIIIIHKTEKILSEFTKAQKLSQGKSLEILKNTEKLLKNMSAGVNKDIFDSLQKAEIENAQAAKITLFISLIAAVLCLILCRWIVNYLNRRICFLEEQADKIAEGQISENKDEDEDEDELSRVSRSLKKIRTSFFEISRIVDLMSAGDYGQRLKNRSYDDRMVDGINRMCNNLSDIVIQANAISSGNYTADITPRSENDELGIAMQRMTRTFREMGQIVEKVSQGDFSQKINKKGENDLLAENFNSMLYVLRVFSTELSRVALEVGTEGILGGQARIENVSGAWKDLIENVNLMARNLTNQVRDIAQVAGAVANGDLSRKITIEARGEILDLKITINRMVDRLNAFSSEVTRVAKEVGTEGRLGGQAQVRDVSGTWLDLTNNVNFMAENLTNQVRNIASVTTAVAKGDLTRKIIVDANGEILELKNTINTMVDRLNSFSSEVIRVAREVGTDGKLGGQADVEGVSGIWLRLTDNVNTMADNLTDQVRGIIMVVTDVAQGRFSSKFQLEAKGEIAGLVNTINNMTETLSLFAIQVTDVAHDVGVKGLLGRQAEVPNAKGAWRELTDNVNRLADNLTVQLRAIGEVATSVTQGNLDRTVDVAAQGEVELLKNNVNIMIGNLRETTRTGTEQNWLNSNLARFNRMLQEQKDIKNLADMLLSGLAEILPVRHSVFYLNDDKDGEVVYSLFSSYGYQKRKFLPNLFREGEGLTGQCAREKKRILVSHVPEDYIRIGSGLGEAVPQNIILVPAQFDDQVLAVIELASFEEFDEIQLSFLDQLAESTAIVINSIGSARRTERLLIESQSMSEELQEQQEELKSANEELEEQTQKLETSKMSVEQRNTELEKAREELNERAMELALSSKYKSEFLANMSHELRTPLNSILLLSGMMAKGQTGELDEEQLKHSQIIHDAGSELLQLINEILDLSKIESGKMPVHLDEMELKDVTENAKHMFLPVAADQGLEFFIHIDENMPPVIRTDPDRVQQVIRNFLSNAFKFTEHGSVRLIIHSVHKENIDSIIGSQEIRDKISSSSHDFFAMSVQDTGTGIPKDKMHMIFEAFQQADGSISRTKGGTGLGLSISREIANILGGTLALSSKEEEGSVFTLILPVHPNQELEDSSEQENIKNPETRALPDSPKIIQERIEDDRLKISGKDERVLLVVEDDPRFAITLMELGRKHKFKVIHANRGTDGINLAEQFLPCAILLDIQLPVMDGWTVMRHLKKNPATRHIPVHVISVVAEENFGYRLGAVQYLVKPVKPKELEQTFSLIDEHLEKKMRKLLIIEDNENEREAVKKIIGNGDVTVTGVGTGKKGIEELKTGNYDALVLDLSLPDMNGYDVLKTISKSPEIKRIPTIIYTGKDLSIQDERKLRRYAETIVIKTAESPGRLLEETTIFLHRVQADMDEMRQNLLAEIAGEDKTLKNRTVLLVDDDIRNAYALNAIMERKGLNVINAANGQEGLDMLKEHPEIDIVLMDVMMPVMDGLEAMRRIRSLDKHAELPIIALTAKALKEDRDNCLEAGASDYMSKPLDHDQLLSLIRVWLSAKINGEK
ncbi:response regulator [Desulfobacterales bacterium HSG17]|nr:response regulator [Desulfobacterales bacterium HSG17]